jgi:hypothetical protein
MGFFEATLDGDDPSDPTVPLPIPRVPNSRDRTRHEARSSLIHSDGNHEEARKIERETSRTRPAAEILY